MFSEPSQKLHPDHPVLSEALIYPSLLEDAEKPACILVRGVSLPEAFAFTSSLPLVPLFCLAHFQLCSPSFYNEPHTPLGAHA